MQQSQPVRQVPESTQQPGPVPGSLNEADSDSQAEAVSIPPVKLAQVGALLSLASAAVHVLAAQQFSQDWWGYGAFFLLLAGFQAIYSSVLLRFPGPAVILFGITVNMVIILLFISALSFGIDSVRTLTVISSVVEISLIITLVALWWTGAARESQIARAGGGEKSSTRNGNLPEANPSQGPIAWLKNLGLSGAIYWVLRIACGLNFVFHGAWGIVGKEDWIPFFGFANIGVETAWVLQPWVGVMDISLGLFVLFAPTRWALLWMIVWAIWTASLRPLTGSAWWYFLERAGNYGPPLALMLYCGWGKSVMDWVMPLRPPVLTRAKINIIMWVLRVSIGAQLITHGLYGVVEGKQLLLDHFASVGLPGGLMDPESFLITVGWIEIGAGLLILLKPLRAVVALVVLWEVFIGLLYPISGLPAYDHPQAYLLFRTMERFGDYAGPFGLLLLMTFGPMWKKEEKSGEGVLAAPAAVPAAGPTAVSAPASAGND